MRAGFMASLITKATNRYEEFLEKGDPRVANWPMMASPWPTFITCLLYVMSVKVGIKKMAKRKPFDVRYLLVIYNISMMALASYVLFEFLVSGWLSGYSFGCQPVDYSYSPQAIRMAKVCWMFFFSKFIEFFDTAFFILRKKFDHISFLHVFHHGALPFFWWFGVKFVPGGFGTFHAMLNSFVHVLMYLYYGLAAMGPAYQKYLWWKKYMTKFQLVQFILMVVHSSQLFFIECDYPMIFAESISLFAIFMLILFADFYRKAYSSNKKHTAENGSIRNVCKLE